MALAPVGAQNTESLVLYSGRNEELIQPIIDRFIEETGVQVDVRYGNTAGLANQIIEEGANSPADVYLGQDAGALGALAQAGALAPLPDDILERVSPVFRSPDGLWVALSGRARVLVYNPPLLEELGLPLPDSIADLTDPMYRGLVAWPPTNASFQSQVTALRLLLGEDETLAWLQDMIANDVIPFSNNTALNQGVLAGEAVMGLTNHYYIFRIYNEDPDAPIALHFFPAGDPGSLINIAGAGVLATSDQPGLAQRLLLYLLGTPAQQYFADMTVEYPVIDGVALDERLTPLDQIEPPDIDLSDLADLEPTLDMIEDSGALD
ncbi:MAG: extracellular solute-binding protein [Anaerolineaceae bacterium]|nr:MAG: extracellular solute-binding protein [Anaerolineaceae bacterium]